ncbi:MAG: flagellar M-ring protein FliF [Sphingorhabdus sp.]|uniref:flagellar basal-body MS-ring/collar protein FliF n=1 Tax=Sphingorhabdus sp. TaxID=1902408 RepID=UPI0025FAD7B2|nr:flagellar basal-body MS-ring/collar protein FliF [Sphingorhabdus sp.]MCO4091301.1 flagellar M-ring protein FliF [Sphingorhabdus sp.]
MADQQILAPDASINNGQLARNVTPGANFGFDGLRGMTLQPAVRKALPTLALTGALGLAALTYFALSTPAQAPLFQGLAEADKAAVADALQSSGISYSLDPGTGAISVDAGKLHEARMLLAGQGLPKAQPTGDAMMASLPMGSSRAVEGETLRGAREADLARTIEAIDAVKTARVHLATPEASVFVRESKEPAASVMLTLQQGRSLSAAQVRAIRHLVASSVPNMSAEDVSIIDQSGALLSSDQTSADDRMFQLQMQMEERYREAVIALLTPIAGPGNFSVEVHADVDASESQSTRETYPENDRALRSEEGNKSVSGAAEEAGGIPGAMANQPPPANAVVNQPPEANAAGTSPGQSEETYNRSFDVGREIAVTHNPQGALRRLSVAVALRDGKGAQKRTPAEIAALENLVKGAVGFKAERGDVVAISARPFVEEAEVVVNFWDEPWFFPLVQQVGAVLGALLAFFIIGRPLVKAVKARMIASKELAETEQKLMQAAARQQASRPANGTVTIDMIESAPSYEARAKLVRAFVRQDPQRAALVVRQMLGKPSNG